MAREKAEIFMPLYLADYDRDTSDLSFEEHGFYMAILRALWSKGGRLPTAPDRLSRVLRTDVATLQRLWPTVVRFLTIEGDEFTQGRLSRELDKALGKVRAAAENGHIGGVERARRLAESKQTGSDPTNPLEANGKQTASSSESDLRDQRSESEGESPRAIPVLPARTTEPEAPITPEAYFAEVVARAGGKVTGQMLAKAFGLVRAAEIPGSLPWVTARAPGNADGMAATIGADPLALADVIPTMRRMFGKAKAGEVSRADEVVKDASFAFGHWCSTFTRLREEIRGVSPTAGNGKPTGPLKPRVLREIPD